MKNNNGITLIALVVTIIVLLILAGVSIAMLTGQNGILTNAKTAQENSSKGALDEAAKIAIGNILTTDLRWKYSSTGTSEAQTDFASAKTRIKQEIESVNSNITSTTPWSADAISGNTFSYTATVDGKTQIVYIDLATGAVTTTAPTTGGK